MSNNPFLKFTVLLKVLLRGKGESNSVQNENDFVRIIQIAKLKVVDGSCRVHTILSQMFLPELAAKAILLLICLSVTIFSQHI